MPSVDNGLSIAMTVLREWPHKAVVANVTKGNFLDPAQRLAFGRAAAERVAMLFETPIVSIAIVFGVCWLAAVGNRA